MNKKVRLSIIFFLLLLFSCDRPQSGRMIKLDGFKLHVIDEGIGEPTVIIEGGLDCETSIYDKLRDPISRFTRVISYDHAGIAFSTPSKMPRTLPNYVSELRQLLEHEKITPPYILVGHSIGGFIVRYFAYKYPEEVVGLVIIDQPPDDWFKYIRSSRTIEDIAKFDNFYDPVKTTVFKGIPLKELEMYESNCELLRGIKIPSHIPVRMLTSVQYGEFQKNVGYYPEDMKKWAEMQAIVLEGLPDAKQIITEKSGHLIQITEPELVVNAVNELFYNYKNSR